MCFIFSEKLNKKIKYPVKFEYFTTTGLTKLMTDPRSSRLMPLFMKQCPASFPITEVLEKIKAYKDELKAGVMKKKDKIENVGYKKYMEEM